MFILDLTNVKCPMNLVMVKNEIHNGSFEQGGSVIIKDENAKKNIIKYLEVKNINFSVDDDKIVIYSS